MGASDPTSTKSLHFSKQLFAFLMVGVIALVGVAIGASIWKSSEHNALAETATKRMVTGGLGAYEDRIRAMELDYSIWTEAYDKIRVGDMPWITANIGSGVGSGSFDLMVIVDPTRRTEFGWRQGGGEAPESGLLDAQALASVSSLLDDVPFDSESAHITYVVSAGELWLLVIARTVPIEGIPEGAAEDDFPRQIIGFRMTDALVGTIGEQFLIEDLSLSTVPVPGKDSIALRSADGEPVAYAVWTPPTPGTRMLRSILAPLIASLLLFAIAAGTASRHIFRSARRLERALVAAEAADKSKSEFLANVSHELRTPMNGVIGIAQLLQLSDLDAEAREMVGILLSSARSQVALVNNLLDVTRIDTGDMVVDLTPFGPADALGQVVQLLEPEARRKGLEMTLTVTPGAEVKLLGDDLIFRQICTNLVGNALKFTDAGTVRASLDGAARGDVVHLTLVVRDTGMGIAQEHHSRIFERFAQVDGSISRKAAGTGLGLCITKSLVELMGGTIHVESELGAGATFTVEVSLARVKSEMERKAA